MSPPPLNMSPPPLNTSPPPLNTSTPPLNTSMSTPHPSTKITIEDIPPEIILKVITALFEIPNAPNSSNSNNRGTRNTNNTTNTQAWLSACRLACKYLNSIAQLFVFQRITLGCEHPAQSQSGLDQSDALTKSLQRISLFRELLDKNPILATGVHEVWLRGYQPHEGAREPSRGITTRAFWENQDLRVIFNTLSAVKHFTFSMSYIRPYGVVKWASNDVSAEMRDAIMRVCCLPTLVKLKVGNVVGFPLYDVLMRAPNLVDLDIHNIDLWEDKRNKLRQLAEVEVYASKSIELRLVSITWSPSLCSLHPLVVCVDFVPLEILNAVLHSSKDTLRYLALHFRTNMSGYESNVITPPLERYTSLKSFKAQWRKPFCESFITVLSTFLTHQFGTGLSRITHLEIQCTSASMFRFSPSHPHDTQWPTLDTVIATGFPHLETLVISMLGMRLPPQESLSVLRFFKRVFPITSEMPGTRILLRMDGMDEVDMTGFTLEA